MPGLRRYRRFIKMDTYRQIAERQHRIRNRIGKVSRSHQNSTTHRDCRKRSLPGRSPGRSWPKQAKPAAPHAPQPDAAAAFQTRSKDEFESLRRHIHGEMHDLPQSSVAQVIRREGILRFRQLLRSGPTPSPVLRSNRVSALLRRSGCGGQNQNEYGERFTRHCGRLNRFTPLV